MRKLVEVKDMEKLSVADMNAIAKTSDKPMIITGEGPRDGNYDIDGDRLIKFIDAVKEMGKLLETINVWDIKEAFIKGKEQVCIDEIIKQRDQWREAVNQIANALQVEVKRVQTSQAVLRETCVHLKAYGAAASSLERANTQLEKFVTLCDRLNEHRKTGLLAALEGLTNETKTEAASQPVVPNPHSSVVA